jgi:hypothetical protein
MSRCRAGCLHRRLVGDYRVARHAAELAREAETGGYETEAAGLPPISPTFKEWLEGHAVPLEERFPDGADPAAARA